MSFRIKDQPAVSLFWQFKAVKAVTDLIYTDEEGKVCGKCLYAEQLDKPFKKKKKPAGNKRVRVFALTSFPIPK